MLAFSSGRAVSSLAIVLILTTAVAAQPEAPEPLDESAVSIIRQQGLEESQVMEYLGWLTDVYGARLTGSPELMKASEWILSTLSEWGLANPHLEAWGPFGRGWTLNKFSMNARGSVNFPVHAFPKAWSPGLGPVTAEVVIFDAETEEDLAAYKGKLAGKFVMMEPMRGLEEPFEPIAERYDAEDLLEMANWAGEEDDRRGPQGPPSDYMRRYQERQRRFNLLVEEQPLAILDRGSEGDYGTLFVSSVSVPAPAGASYRDRPSGWNPRGATVIPQFTLEVEQYNRLYRVLKKGLPVSLEVELDVTYDEEDPMDYNVIAELPGADPEIGDEVVIIGGHLDSWHAGTGAADNAAGCAVMMEAIRILQQTYAALGTKPRRTIRIALWTGEEQGLLGSRAYVAQHFAESGGRGAPPSSIKPEHEKVSAYYNFDNGTGKIRGVYLQGNEAVAPIFRTWLRPFNDLGAATLTLQNTGGTDHLSFDAVGIPGFQFIQEPIAYDTKSHHSNMDVYDHTIADDLMQAATVVASFVYHTAQRQDKLPRKPLERVEVRGPRG